jgi:hypothetical protein
LTNSQKDKLYNEIDVLFDILRCKHSIICKEDPTCSDPKCCHVAISPICNCPSSLKIPQIELKFIKAQRLKIGMKSAYQIHCRDTKEHTRLAKQCKRKDKTLMFKKLEEKKLGLSSNKFFNEEIEVDIIEKAKESSNQFIDTKIDDGIKESVLNTKHFPLLAQIVLRYGTSNREAAAISSAVLVDLGIVNEKDNKLIIDHHKVHREKKKVMEKFQKEDLQLYHTEEIKALFFDGRNNLSLLHCH